MGELDSLAETRQLSDQEVEERARCFSKISELERMVSLDLKQKSEN